jgi:hypothetical protein
MAKTNVIFMGIAIMAALVVAAVMVRPDAKKATQPAVAAAPDNGIWQPHWNVLPDNAKKAKPELAPTFAFAEEGFRGSPIPSNDRERKKTKKLQEDFAQSFQNEPTCLGMTLKLGNSEATDFDLQVFDGVYGRKGSYQWILYRMDTSGVAGTGEASGVDTKSGLDEAVKSVCSVIHHAITPQGGRVE